MLKIRYFTIFDKFIESLSNASAYNLKLCLLMKFMPLMTRTQGEEVMKKFGEVMDYPPEESIYRRNINPI